MGCESDCLPEEQDIELRYLRMATVVSAGFYKPLRSSPRWPKLAKMTNLPGTTWGWQ
jgi:hypothetical protein